MGRVVVVIIFADCRWNCDAATFSAEGRIASPCGKRDWNSTYTTPQVEPHNSVSTHIEALTRSPLAPDSRKKYLY
jgi:hypothetical protein